jgi:hypothetical protein
LGREDENLAGDTAVDMHFVERPAVLLDRDEYGREHAQDRGRSKHDPAKKCGGFFIAPAGDLAHVPDHRTLRVEVGRADEQAPALAVLSGDATEEVTRYITLD